jgi:tRNA nucleotidyltransferase (CCA-adding enzyme)
VSSDPLYGSFVPLMEVANHWPNGAVSWSLLSTSQSRRLVIDDPIDCECNTSSGRV